MPRIVKSGVSGMIEEFSFRDRCVICGAAGVEKKVEKLKK